MNQENFRQYNTIVMSEPSLKDTLRFLRKKVSVVPEDLIILGSGLTRMVKRVKVKIDIPYQRIPGFKKTNAPTHPGHLIVGKINKREALIMQGRYHVYEGYEASFTTYPVRALAALGVRRLITTNLSGGINPSFRKGDFMVVEDHLNLSGVNPLIWNSKQPKRQFTDMHKAYSPRLIKLLGKVALERKIVLRKGVLAYLTGPNFETQAELKALKLLGADAVGWSLIPEVLEARRYAVEVLGLVCISDISQPENFGPVDLDEIYRIGEKKAEELFLLLEGLIDRL